MNRNGFNMGYWMTWVTNNHNNLRAWILFLGWRAFQKLLAPDAHVINVTTAFYFSYGGDEMFPSWNTRFSISIHLTSVSHSSGEVISFSWVCGRIHPVHQGRHFRCSTTAMMEFSTADTKHKPNNNTNTARNPAIFVAGDFSVSNDSPWVSEPFFGSRRILRVVGLGR